MKQYKTLANLQNLSWGTVVGSTTSSSDRDTPSSPVTSPDVYPEFSCPDDKPNWLLKPVPLAVTEEPVDCAAWLFWFCKGSLTKSWRICKKNVPLYLIFFFFLNIKNTSNEKAAHLINSLLWNRQMSWFRAESLRHNTKRSLRIHASVKKGCINTLSMLPS